jgi:tRNA pseudouridine55 synthase
MNNKSQLEKINGILLLDKALHITSNGALQRVKRLFMAKKAGHTGSLDPLATGMLPICFGEATKICQFLLESDKHYQVTAQLGTRTATGDAEGEVIASEPVTDMTRDRIEASLTGFTGAIDQVPPMFSAIKFQGQPLYKLARRGIEIERKARTVHIHSLRLSNFNTVENTFEIDVHCSKGTYVRTLVDDIGQVLGCGAHVSALRRSAVAPYQGEKMYTLTELEEILEGQGMDSLRHCMLPLESSVQGFPAVKLSTSATFYLRMGQPVMASHIQTKGLIRLFSDNGQFMGIGEMLDDGRVTPRRLLDYPAKKIAS